MKIPATMLVVALLVLAFIFQCITDLLLMAEVQLFSAIEGFFRRISGCLRYVMLLLFKESLR